MTLTKMTVIKAFGTQLNLACDGCCEKAFGTNNRPKVQLSDDENDYEWLADHELGSAPVDTGIYEGGHAKPTDKKHNKWCFRECERSNTANFPEIPILLDFSNRVRNKES